VESPLGKKHRASDWLEDRGETEYYLETDGSFYNYEHGVLVHVAQLSKEDVERLSRK
jgi:aminopeptidase C